MSKTEEYLKNLIRTDDTVLQQIGDSARENNIPTMLKETANLLSTLIAASRPHSILEIGTAIGYSGILMLKNAREDTSLTTIECDENNFKAAKENFKKFKLNDRVTQLFGDAGDVLSKINHKFDFIFLDGPKGQYMRYLPVLIDILDFGGILVADNVLYFGKVAGENPTQRKKRTIVNNLKSFNEQISYDLRFKTSIINIGDGVSISVKIKN